MTKAEFIASVLKMLEVSKLPVEKVESDLAEGTVTLDDVTITLEERMSVGLRPPRRDFRFCVSYEVPIPQTYWEPADVDIVEVGTYPTLGAAVASALATVVQGRIGAYQDALADDAMAADLEAGF